MAMFSVRVADDLAAQFDAAAGQAGGRSALLRRLIGEACAGGPRGGAAAVSASRSGARIMVRLTAADAAIVDAEAAAMALPRASWVAALVHARVSGGPTFGRSEAATLVAIHGELRRIGVNVNQIARALNTAVLEGRVLDLELASLEDLRREMRGHLVALREAFVGNLEYWAVGG